MRRPALLHGSLAFLLLAGCGPSATPDVSVTQSASISGARFTCPAGAPAAVFVAETAPPAALSPGQAVQASVTFANCSNATWSATAAGAPTGTKLGFAAPRDSGLWGPGRVALGGDVAPGTQVTIPLELRAPASPGSAGYQWAVVEEGVAWLNAPSPLHAITVEGPPGGVSICPGVRADNSGGEPASTQIQQCIDAAPPGSTVELPPGTYRVTTEIHIDKPLTLRTAGTAANPLGCLDGGGPACAVLRADAELAVTHGFFRLGTTNSVSVEHIVIDGNRTARLGSAAAGACAAGNDRGPGFNAASSNCTGCSFVASATIHALCGSGFEWIGEGATITASTFRDNGDHNQTNMWSDGLTLLRSNGAHVEHDSFADNSDVDFISGGAQNGSFTDSTVTHMRQASFAGMMLDDFNNPAAGDFTGLLVTRNRIDCGPNLCDIGFEIGPHPWYLSGNTRGGTVSGNQISGGKFNINVEGGGTLSAPVVVSGNTVGPSGSEATFDCGSRATTSFNVSPDSFVDLQGGPQPTGAITFHGCQ